MVEEFVASSYLLHVIVFTLLQATLSSLLSLALALPLARALNRIHFPGKHLLLRVMQFTWMLPSIAVVLGLVMVYGRSGWLNQLLHGLGLKATFSFYGLGAILLAHIFLNMPLATRFIFNELVRIPSESWRLATQLGLSSRDIFRLLEWPQVKSSFLGTGCLIFLLCFNSFTLVLALGGGPRYATIEVAIYHAVKFDVDLITAFSLGLFQTVFCSLLALASFSFIKKSLSFSTIGADPKTIGTAGGRSDYFFVLMAMLLLLPPILAILLSGFNPTFVAVINEPSFYRSLLMSLFIATSSALTTVVLALIISYYLYRLCDKNRWYAAFIETLALFNLIVPPTILSTLFFFLLIAIGNADSFSMVAVIVINSLMSLPFALRAILNASQEIAEKYQKLCASLGFSFWQRWHLIEMPLLRKNIANALAISTLLSLGDFSAIAFFGSASLQTLPFYIYNLIASYQLDKAAVAVLLLISVSVIVLLAIERVVGGKNVSG